MDEIYDRLVGKLALDEASRVERVLVAQLNTKTVLFSENVDSPEQLAATALAAHNAAVTLRPAGVPYMMRIEGTPDESASESASEATCAIYSGKYFLHLFATGAAVLTTFQTAYICSTPRSTGYSPRKPANRSQVTGILQSKRIPYKNAKICTNRHLRPVLPRLATRAVFHCHSGQTVPKTNNQDLAKCGCPAGDRTRTSQFRRGPGAPPGTGSPRTAAFCARARVR